MGRVLVFIQDGTTIRVFVYVGEGQLVVIDSKTGTCELQTMGTSYASAAHILVTLPAYDFFAVLRPASVAK